MTKLSIAVLPFVNMSSDKENEYFSDGITEEILNALAKINGLKVTSRTSSFYFKGKNISLKEIGKQLDVEMILEGSVRKSKNNVRITVQLINTNDDSHIWSDNYNGDLTDVFKLQDNVSLNVAEKIRESVGHFNIQDKLQDVNFKNMEAYDMFLKGNFYLNQHSKKEIDKGVLLLKKVAHLEKDNPTILAANSIVYTFQAGIQTFDVDRGFKKAKNLAERALQLDKYNSTAHLALAKIMFLNEYNLNATYQHLNQAIRNKPNFSNAYSFLALVELSQCRFDEALHAIDNAISLDVLDDLHNYRRALILSRMSRVFESIECLNKVIAKNPFFINARTEKGTQLILQKKYDEAIELYRNMPGEDNSTYEYLPGLGHVYALKGDKNKALEYLERMNNKQYKYYNIHPEGGRILIYVALKDFNKAFSTIMKDIKEKQLYVKFHQSNTFLDPLRSYSEYSILNNIFKKSGKLPINVVLKYEKSGIDKHRVDEISKKLRLLMIKEKPFLDAEISLKSLAENISESTNHVSQVINEKHNINFFDFINSYRIDEMKKLIKIPSNSNLTLLALAYESGFNSKTTFNTAFKKLKGESPKVYFKNLGLL